jgi:CRISPR type IV-associated protein Csf3
LDTFKVTMNLCSPLVTQGGYMTLDALLAALIFEATGDLQKAHHEIPLQQTQGVWHGSAANLTLWHEGRAGFVANLRASHDLDLNLIAQNKQGNTHAKLGLTRRRDYGAVMNSYKTYSASEIAWYGQGDAQAVEQWLRQVHFIGKRRASGFGQVQSLRIEPDELDGVTGFFGEPLRPVPVELFKGDPHALKADAAWRPAYWDPVNRAICHVPAGL